MNARSRYRDPLFWIKTLALVDVLAVLVLLFTLQAFEEHLHFLSFLHERHNDSRRRSTLLAIELLNIVSSHYYFVLLFKWQEWQNIIWHATFFNPILIINILLAGAWGGLAGLFLESLVFSGVPIVCNLLVVLIVVLRPYCIPGKTTERRKSTTGSEFFDRGDPEDIEKQIQLKEISRFSDYNQSDEQRILKKHMRENPSRKDGAPIRNGVLEQKKLSNRETNSQKRLRPFRESTFLPLLQRPNMAAMTIQSPPPPPPSIQPKSPVPSTAARPINSNKALPRRPERPPRPDSFRRENIRETVLKSMSRLDTTVGDSGSESPTIPRGLEHISWSPKTSLDLTKQPSPSNSRFNKQHGSTTTIVTPSSPGTPKILLTTPRPVSSRATVYTNQSPPPQDENFPATSYSPLEASASSSPRSLAPSSPSPRLRASQEDLINDITNTLGPG